MLVEVGAVELGQAVGVGGEVGGDPVEDHADAPAVQGVDQEHQVVGSAVPARRGVVADDLVAPRPGRRVLGDGHQLDVREAHLVGVVGELGGDLAVGEGAVALAGHAHPGAEMDLVDRHRRRQRLAGGAVGHPVGVAPLEAGEVLDLRGGPGGQLRGERVGVGPVESRPAVGGEDRILVQRPRPDRRDESRPDPGRAPPREGIDGGVPAVELADDRDFPRVRRPDGEMRAGRAVEVEDVGPQLLVEAFVGPLANELQVEVAQDNHRSTNDPFYMK